jgi:hypothetical protein
MREAPCLARVNISELTSVICLLPERSGLFNALEAKALDCVPALGPPGKTKMEPLLLGSMAPSGIMLVI